MDVSLSIRGQGDCANTYCSFQESYFSRRMLIFLNGQVAFKCTWDAPSREDILSELQIFGMEDYTYKLSMRETRFYGVEAIRMTPVGGAKMHGRDGILAHSYLLRGGRAESHGCVAFKDYPRFLKAFKQGKVKQIVVVPSLSKAPQLRVASAGRGA